MQESKQDRATSQTKCSMKQACHPACEWQRDNGQAYAQVHGAVSVQLSSQYQLDCLVHI